MSTRKKKSQTEWFPLPEVSSSDPEATKWWKDLEVHKTNTSLRPRDDFPEPHSVPTTLHSTPTHDRSSQTPDLTITSLQTSSPPRHSPRTLSNSPSQDVYSNHTPIIISPPRHRSKSNTGHHTQLKHSQTKLSSLNGTHTPLALPMHSSETSRHPLCSQTSASTLSSASRPSTGNSQRGALTQPNHYVEETSKLQSSSTSSATSDSYRRSSPLDAALLTQQISLMELDKLWRTFLTSSLMAKGKENTVYDSKSKCTCGASGKVTARDRTRTEKGPLSEQTPPPVNRSSSNKSSIPPLTPTLVERSVQTSWSDLPQVSKAPEATTIPIKNVTLSDSSLTNHTPHPPPTTHTPHPPPTTHTPHLSPTANTPHTQHPPFTHHTPHPLSTHSTPHSPPTQHSLSAHHTQHSISTLISHPPFTHHTPSTPLNSTHHTSSLPHTSHPPSIVFTIDPDPDPGSPLLGAHSTPSPHTSTHHPTLLPQPLSSTTCLSPQTTPGDGPLTLSQALSLHRPDFILRSQRRERRVRERSEVRAEKVRLISRSKTLSGRANVMSWDRPKAQSRVVCSACKLKERPAISYYLMMGQGERPRMGHKKMYQASKRAWDKLPEVRRKAEEEKRRSQAETNRLRVKLYQKEVLERMRKKNYIKKMKI